MTTSTALQTAGFNVVGKATSAEQAIDRLIDQNATDEPSCDLLLVDLNLPAMNGDELCEFFNSNSIYSHVPVIMITGDEDVMVLQRAYESGVVDFIRKPFNRIELNARVMTAAQNVMQRRELIYLAHYDRLTGLVNRGLLIDRLSTAIRHAERNQLEVVLLFIDLDNFKSLNDTLGHSLGDVALKMTAERLLACTRESDTVARLGGDEFVIMLPDVEPENARHLDRLINAIHQTLSDVYVLGETELGETSWHLGGSVGIATYPNDATDVETLMKIADMKMYKEKSLRKKMLLPD